jgi:hypothetical protein
LRHVMNKKQGMTTLPDLAAASNHLELTVEKGLTWLSASGQIRYHQEASNIVILPGTGKQSEEKAGAEMDLLRLITETNSFRSFFKRARAEFLLKPAV